MGYDRDRAAERNAAFMLDPDAKGILIRCVSFGEDLPAADPLESFDFPRQIREFCDQVIRRHLIFAEAHADLDDDWLPALKPYLGIAEHSCFLGGPVSYGGNTSYHTPPLSDLSGWRELRFEREHPHYAMLLEGMAYLKEKSAEYGFFTSLRGGDGPMDIANAVRGNDLFCDFYDEPEETKEFISFCAEAAAWTFENQRPFASVVRGGVISGMGTWMPEGAIGHLSEDASCLCSPRMYEEFGLPYTDALVERYSYAELHVHSLGRAMLPLFRKMKKIGTFQLSGDPHQPSAAEVYREYAEPLEGTTVLLDMTAAEVRENIAFLRGRRTVVNLTAADKEEAKEILSLVRE
jgi:hypothetical protein